MLSTALKADLGGVELLGGVPGSIGGGMIMNVVRYVSMQAIARNERVLRLQDFLDGIRREYTKENRLE